MRTRLRWLLAVALLLVVAVPLTILFLRTHERVTRVETLPPQGEARYNPLYVLGQALRADGLEANARPRLDLTAMALQPHDTVVLLQDSAALPPTTARALLDWVERGGHLIVRTTPLTADDAADDTADNGPLLDMLGVDGTSRRNACAPFHVADDVNHVEFCDSRRFDVDPPTGIRVAQAWRDEEHGHVFVRLRRAAGTVDVLADLNFMKNSAAPGVDGLHDKAHRDLARYVLAPNYGKGTVWLVYGTRPPSLWQRVFHDGWPVWVPLLLALLGWLWLRAQRMGSLLPSPAVERRSLLEHVRASGEHLLRYGKAPLLYDAVRQAFLNRLRRRAPTAAALGGDARIHAIATLLQWSHDRVRIALQPPAAHDVAGLRDRIRLLIQMRNLL
ncbi:MAG TPA: hypothetical protein DEB32_15120 [Stenotrophomonas sp.]|jgi:hypothetical protein|uniref:DUF4350 domain-containing protein n=1 Tax=Stenotrophomonas maltophilia TaxID=40324 RepID=A0A4S2CV66_STEMA|nr:MULTISPECIES: DUF4350 domain-containing protein [Stenotrophomonas]QIO89909.1 hypothetical protein G9274_003594 [Stenotrophomonas rhizophila]TGY32828.1 DUF4350 domain-containing protein [Stenotrophomonas maltophilia]HBS64007.1 hypothetical protein [Stenotrophomonas sp.]